MYIALISKRLEEEKDYSNKEKYAEMYEKIPGYLNQVFTQIHSDLSHQKYDTQLSGTTCVSVLFDRNTIFCANVGDSRAVLYSYKKE